jgi:hypothetical protein
MEAASLTTNWATAADEVERLKAIELEAEHHYVDALKRGDSSALRSAAEDWRKASNALTEYVAKNPDPYRR